jgi:small subunit ribosomal protein S16
MIKLRLRRMGAKKKPSYRIVVADARAKRDGRFVEIVGHYNPLTEPSTVVIKGDRARYWLGQGAQPTDRVAKLLKKQGITDENGKVIAVATEAGAEAPAAATEAAAE